MVRRVLQFIHREVRGLHEAAYLLAGFAVLSQLLALVRDRLLAHYFGAGTTLDVYYAAFRIPDVIFVMVASLVSVYVLIPFIVERSRVSSEEVRRFISNIFTVFALAIISISVVIYLFTPYITNLIFPGLTGAAHADLVLLTRILLLQPILLGFSSLLSSLTQVYQRFILYALSPLLYNAGIIFGLFFLYPSYGMAGLGFGVVIGAILHLGTQVPFLLRRGILPRFVNRINFREIRDIVVVSLPRTIALSTNEISLLFLVGFASIISEGSIAVFNLAFNLQHSPLAVIGISYSVAAFPTLAKLFSRGEQSVFHQHVITAVRHIIFWSVPITFFIIVLRAQIVRVILGSGAFDWSDTRLTAAALALFVVSLTSQGLMMLFVRSYYASGNTKKPFVVNVTTGSLAVVFTFTLLFLFEKFDVFRYFIESLLRVEGIDGTAILMLPLGFSLAAMLNSIIFWILFERDFHKLKAQTANTFIQSFSAAVVLGVVTHTTLGFLGSMLDLNTFVGIFSQGFIAGIVGITAGVLVLKLFGSKELYDVWSTLHRKFWKSDVIIGD
jgi:putative peptidoglycan lipid II flippase